MLSDTSAMAGDRNHCSRSAATWFRGGPRPQIVGDLNPGEDEQARRSDVDGVEPTDLRDPRILRDRLPEGPTTTRTTPNGIWVWAAISATDR